MTVQVAIWDLRAGSSKRQANLVAPQNMTRLTQVQASSDGHVVIAGARNGHVSSLCELNSEHRCGYWRS